jgi:hypothetical protein
MRLTAFGINGSVSSWNAPVSVKDDPFCQMVARVFQAIPVHVEIDKD